MSLGALTAMDLNLLVVLDVLLAERSVTRAGKRLGLSQPAVSNALGRLREALGDPLLVRTPQGMVPTPRALALEQPLRDALARIDLALGDTPDAFQPALSRRTFSLAATDYVQLVVLPPLLARLQIEAPGVVLAVQALPSGSPWDPLELGGVDLVLTGAAAPHARLHRRALFRDRVVCMLRRGHPALGRKLTLERYLALSHVEVLAATTRGWADEVLAQLGHTRRIVATVPHFLVAPFLLASTDCCFTLAERIAGPVAAILPLEVIPLPFAMPTLTVWAYWSERMHVDPGHRWLRRVAGEVAATSAAGGVVGGTASDR